MAPKAKGQKGRKVSASAAGTSKRLRSTIAGPPVEVQSAVVDEAPVANLEHATNAPKRRVQRRDTDDQTERYIARKLGHLSEARLHSVQSKSGVSLYDYVKEEVRKKKKVRGRLGSKFTLQLYRDFDFERGTFDALSDCEVEDEDAEMGLEMCEALSQAHDENPSARKPTPLIKYLERCGRLSKFNYYGLLNGVLAGPLLCHKHARKLQVAVLHYVARFRVDLEFPSAWEVVKGQLDAALNELWQAAEADKVSIHTFLKSKRALFGLYVPEDDIDRLVATQGMFSDAPQTVLKFANTMVTGASMFESTRLSVARTMHEREIAATLRELENEQFNLDELENHRKLMASRADVLRQLAGKRPLSWKGELPMLGAMLQFSAEDPADVYEMFYCARVKTISIAKGLMRRNWWEELLFGEGGVAVPDVPTFATLPAAVIEPMAGARETAERLLQGVTTLRDAITILMKSEETLLDLDKSYHLDLTFLASSAETLLQNHVRAQLLQCLPSDSVSVSFKQAWCD